MPQTLAQRRLNRLWKRGIGLPGDNSRVLEAARKLTNLVDLPVLGGIAVILHGVPRTTVDVDLYTVDRKAADEQIRAAGGVWDARQREYNFAGVTVHTVTSEEAGHDVRKTSNIQGICVVSLADLMAIKLRSGLNNAGRAKDLGDVQELIRAVPLDKTFALKLPKDLRDDYKRMVDAVRADQRSRQGKTRF